MKARCNDPGAAAHGARGVKYDPRWQDFAAFYKDMGPRPANTTLDRIDPFQGYSRANCQWGTDLDQARNKRKAEFIAYDSADLNVPGTHAEWARHLKRTTGKEWTSKALRYCLQFMTLDQIVNSTHPGQLTRQRLIHEAKRRETQAVLRKMGRMTVETLVSMGQPLTDREVAIYKRAEVDRVFATMFGGKDPYSDEEEDCE
jgi:hypothetical protein